MQKIKIKELVLKFTLLHEININTLKYLVDKYGVIIGNKYRIKPIICACYEDTQDFIDEWIQYGYTRTEAREKLLAYNHAGEFKKFPDGKIIRLVC